MRRLYHHVILIFSILIMLIFSGCGDNQQGNNPTTPTAVTASETALIETDDTLSAVHANDGTSIWSIKKNEMSKPLALNGKYLYYSTSSNIAAVNLTSGKEIWSEPINGNASDLQISSKFVYVLNNSFSNSGVLSVFDATNGTLKWHIDNVGLNNQGSGSSVMTDGQKSSNFIISGNTLYTAVSGVLTALDATTGSQLWQFTSSNLDSFYVGGLLLSADGKKLVASYASSSTNALYIVQTDSHQEVWHLDSTTASTSFFGKPLTISSINLSWFTVTSDNHLFFSAAFSEDGYGPAQTPQDGYHYASLDNGSEIWFLPLGSQDRSTLEGVGESLLASDNAFYSVGGPGGGDVSATSLSSHLQVWKTPGSGSYGELFLANDVLLASSGASIASGGGGANGHTLTAFHTQDGKQLWQVQVNNIGIQEIFPVAQRVFIQEWGQTQSENNTIVVSDLHTGKKLWSIPTPIGSGQNTYWAKTLRNVVVFKL